MGGDLNMGSLGIHIFAVKIVECILFRFVKDYFPRECCLRGLPSARGKYRTFDFTGIYPLLHKHPPVMLRSFIDRLNKFPCTGLAVLIIIDFRNSKARP